MVLDWCEGDTVGEGWTKRPLPQEQRRQRVVEAMREVLERTYGEDDRRVGVHVVQDLRKEGGVLLQAGRPSDQERQDDRAKMTAPR